MCYWFWGWAPTIPLKIGRHAVSEYPMEGLSKCKAQQLRRRNVAQLRCEYGGLRVFPKAEGQKKFRRTKIMNKTI